MNSSDHKAKFISLIEQHKAIIFKISSSYCHNNADREDLVQEIVIQLWNSFDKYDEQRKWSTWMYRIALNVAISFYRKDKRRRNAMSPLADNILNFPEETDQEEMQEHIKLLYEFIDRLNKLDKALMIMYLDDKSYKEISDILGITQTNVATKINRIKKKLKQQFSTIKAE